jgi:phage terminase large subunit-like protein
MSENESKGEILADLIPGQWYEFNDGKQFLHSIVLMRIEQNIRIVLLLENPEKKISTVVFPASSALTTI